MAGALLIRTNNFFAPFGTRAPSEKQASMDNNGSVITLGGVPGHLPRGNYYDAKTGLQLNPDGGGKKYLSLWTLMQIKRLILSARAATSRREVDAALQAASEIVLKALGEVDPEDRKIS